MSLPNAEKLSPMMQQYLSVKQQYPDCVLFFRLGDFYEMFFDDAQKISKELELTLTGRDCGLEERAPMCGVPYHSAESYISRLIKKGYKVAICEQMEDPATAKGMVRREVIRVVTPGTVVESAMLDEGSNNYITSIYSAEKGYGLAFSDITTGEILLCDITDNGVDRLLNELGKICPTEVIYNAALAEQKEIGTFLKERIHCTANLLPDDQFDYQAACKKLTEHFHADTIGELGLTGLLYGIPAAAALLSYVQQTNPATANRIISINRYQETQFMNLDLGSRRNLELIETMRTREKRGTLLWVLDRTQTAMGKRLLRSYIEQPLVNAAAINKRLNAVQELFEDTIFRQEIREILSKIPDFERLMTRVIYGSVSPRELIALQQGLLLLPQLRILLQKFQSTYLREVYFLIEPLDDLVQSILAAINDNPPALLKDGGVIRTGFNAQLDELREIFLNAKEYIAKIEQQEREKTGIRNLKIGFNKVFGYYIEISKSNASLAPESYIRKQTLVNGERFITQELKELEEKILGAGEKITQLEAYLYNQICSVVASQLHKIQSISSGIAKLDVYANFAHIAVEYGYCRPDVDLSGEISIEEGRHPVVEQLLDGRGFVANNTFLNGESDRVAIITGPNMAGKSTYMRQTALIVLMAQTGCFVPAKRAHIGVVDGIYTRVGASDDLASGQSTFMVEMNEVAYILKNATANSLLILDEIGRGTSTFDGMSIARAVVEHIADPKKLGAKSLFATHYHELTELEEQISGVKNYNVAVIKKGFEITFLRRIVPGGADDSYGIEVSRLAGIPDSIIKRAHTILQSLEEGRAVSPVKSKIRETVMDGQLTLTSAEDHPVIARIKSVDINELTPIQALNLVYELKTLAEKATISL